METESKKVFRYLQKRYPSIKDIIVTYAECSKDTENGKMLVNSSAKCIDFDKLTKWVCEQEKQELLPSADSLAFGNSCIYLIEFKAGDRVTHSGTKKKLIRNVKNKINGSEITLFRNIVSNIDDVEESKILIRFYLVVDMAAMGISPLVATLASLSKQASQLSDPKIHQLYEDVLFELRNLEDVNNSDHFDEIDIWYSELFDKHLESHGIGDVCYDDQIF